jgi:hypothetical protein
MQLAGHRQAIQAGHVDVEHGHVGPGPLGCASVAVLIIYSCPVQRRFLLA